MNTSVAPSTAFAMSSDLYMSPRWNVGQKGHPEPAFNDILSVTYIQDECSRRRAHSVRQFNVGLVHTLNEPPANGLGVPAHGSIASALGGVGELRMLAAAWSAMECSSGRYSSPSPRPHTPYTLSGLGFRTQDLGFRI